MQELLSQTTNINDAYLLVVITGLCVFVLLQNKVIRDMSKDYSELIKESTAAMSELSTLLKGFLLK